MPSVSKAVQTPTDSKSRKRASTRLINAMTEEPDNTKCHSNNNIMDFTSQPLYIELDLPPQVKTESFSLQQTIPRNGVLVASPWSYPEGTSDAACYSRCGGQLLDGNGRYL